MVRWETQDLSIEGYDDINTNAYSKMRTAHNFYGPLSIDRTTQLSSIGGPLGHPEFSLISHTESLCQSILKHFIDI